MVAMSNIDMLIKSVLLANIRLHANYLTTLALFIKTVPITAPVDTL